ncbi:ATP-grasp domain-containing protein [Ideonella azotifigens]|uniref:Geranyl-CoA carboxylase subunit apha n=1 Tax=Ideonella azotifigens TaxID=513160 RepID=A0ABP3V2D2_9BURK|nr:biotin carboxylase N-terminal domain-containing protein [Ideonella azotifigens]MCD2340842.1 ATP-grasp domain-containing protein [Ideonella azotifigens]
MSKPFTKVLIANRGEIACRVMRTARAMGYRTVAVYSEVDAQAPHVVQADEAVCIGPAAAAESYLSIPALLDAARRTGADAVHPGYGFLSERADFAQACAEAGLVFIGPPPSAIEAMGDKAGAKRRMLAAGVPCAPGYLPAEGEPQVEDEQLVREARRLGAPLLVKAVAGGGGRGMRLLREDADLADASLAQALSGARREAENAFGNGRLMLERLIEGGRHIEIQVFADAHGQAVHLGERDCTAQRRRQKVIEEAPSPSVSPEMRAAMGADAVAAALAVGYVGAGTVEFIVDAEGRHFFLEMNTRLQVEHPVTEAVTGFDLVQWQLRVAAGEPLRHWLPRGQDDVRFDPARMGHAIEVRLYAEDPYQGFQPQTGTVLHWQPQHAVAAGQLAGGGQLQASASVRIDAGIAEGGQVSPWYDAMIAKFIAHGTTREDARRRLIAALQDSPLLGLATNRRFLIALLQHPQFIASELTTTRLDEWAAEDAPPLQRPAPSDADWRLAAALRWWSASSPGGLANGWRGAGMASQTVTLRWREAQRKLRLTLSGQGDAMTVTDDSSEQTLKLLSRDGARWRISADGVAQSCIALSDAQGGLHFAAANADFVFTEPAAAPRASDMPDASRLCSPVAGTVASVAVQPGERVALGQPLVCVEAMKMEMWQHARAAGTVRAVHVAPKASVRSGALLVELTLEAS